jgi:hypothetical protein
MLPTTQCFVGFRESVTWKGSRGCMFCGFQRVEDQDNNVAHEGLLQEQAT